MKFQPGKTKTGGRSPGTPNKRTGTLLEILDQGGLEPVSKLIELLPQLTAKEQADICLDLMGYIYPKRKAVEVSADQSISIRSPMWDSETMIDVIRKARGDVSSTYFSPAQLEERNRKIGLIK